MANKKLAIAVLGATVSFGLSADEGNSNVSCNFDHIADKDQAFQAEFECFDYERRREEMRKDLMEARKSRLMQEKEILLLSKEVNSLKQMEETSAQQAAVLPPLPNNVHASASQAPQVQEQQKLSATALPRLFYVTGQGVNRSAVLKTLDGRQKKVYSGGEVRPGVKVKSIDENGVMVTDGHTVVALMSISE